MIYRRFKDLDLSLLGFGLMRLPLNEDKTINKNEVKDMVKYAMDHGLNYFDTAWPYHNGNSERVIGEILKEYPRKSFYLADKFPGHQHLTDLDCEKIFNEQLNRCQVDYFDFYLLHNVNENCYELYMDEELGIIDYFLEQKRLGRIKHLGFSTHGRIDMLKDFLDKYGDVMEFCQIQMNYLDYTIQNAKEKYDILTEKNIPVWVMEPLRGGKLKNTSEAFRFLMRFPNIHMILSGMSAIDQMRENVAIFHAEDPLSDLDTNGVMLKAKELVNMVPCTKCHYCDGCPMGLDIPMFMESANEARLDLHSLPVTMRLEALEEDKLPSSCIKCGACIEKCPQKINIPEVIEELDSKWKQMKKWKDICREREEAQKNK